MRGARTNTWHHVVLPAAGRPTRVCSPAPLFRPTAPKKPARATPRTTHHAPRRASCWHRPRSPTQRQERAGHRAKSYAKSTGRHRAKSDKHRKASRQEHRKAPRQERQAPEGRAKGTGSMVPSTGSIAPRAPEAPRQERQTPKAPRQGHREASRQEHRKASRREHGRRGHEDKATSASRPGRARSSQRLTQRLTLVAPDSANRTPTGPGHGPPDSNANSNAACSPADPLAADMTRYRLRCRLRRGRTFSGRGGGCAWWLRLWRRPGSCLCLRARSAAQWCSVQLCPRCVKLALP